MLCSICTHSDPAKIVEDYIYSGSLRQTAMRFGVGYRSLQRHIDLCLASIYSEKEQREYREGLENTARKLEWYFGYKNRKPRPKSIIKKDIQVSWGRRAWIRKKKNGDNDAKKHKKR